MSLDADIAIVSLAEAKEYLKVTLSGDDTIITSLINNISAWVARYLNRILISKERTEYYSGDGSEILQLRVYPIVSVASLYVDNNREFDTASLVDADDFIVKKGVGMLTAFNLFGAFVSGESNIKVTYTAGYTAGTGNGNGTMPYDIKQATLRLLDKYFRQVYTQRKGDVASESISGMNITYDLSKVPKDVAEMLAPHRKLMPAPQYEYAD